jgi:Fe-Mn family superoxide dismutase
MVLHELYFDNLKEGGGGNLPVASRFERGNFDLRQPGAVEIRLHRTANLRGVGWAICCLDPAKGRLANLWVSSHEVGHVAGFLPILVLDVWEHAYLLDYAPAERPKYIEAFLSNLNWSAVEKRLARTRPSPPNT